MTGYKDIYVIAEQRDGVMAGVTYELLGAARGLADFNNEKVNAVLIGDNVKQQADMLIAYGADTVYTADSPLYKDYMTEAYAAAVTYIISEYKPAVILIAATALGRDLGPRVSARVGTGLTADCTKLEMKEDGLYMTRPAFGGNLFAVIVCPDSRPQMSTVRPGVFKSLEPDYARKGTVVDFTAKVQHQAQGRLKLVSQTVAAAGDDRIENAKILVSLGRGAGKHNVVEAEALASVLGGSVSGSRAVVDAGHLSQDRQVGQTGKTVRPECYLALGISGAVQHLAGMEESEYIIAVNKDKDAPVFGVADLCVVGDVNKILPLVTQEVKKLKNL